MGFSAGCLQRNNKFAWKAIKLKPEKLSTSNSLVDGGAIGFCERASGD